MRFVMHQRVEKIRPNGLRMVDLVLKATGGQMLGCASVRSGSRTIIIIIEEVLVRGDGSGKDYISFDVN